MGFFSSRKAEDNDAYQVAIGVGTTNEKTSVVQVIRSRFYGKKSKEREDHSISYHGEISAAQALSSPTIPVASAPITSSPLRREAVPGILRTYDERPLPATPSKKRPTVEISTPSPSIRQEDGSKSPHHKNVESIDSATPHSPRKNTDTVTVTLAQRLNELAVANSDGLLSDDEYRILRQNLFERFASNAAVPTETSIVPASPARPRPKKVGTTGDQPSARPLSNFHVERPASISSRNSGTSAVGSLFRKATGRRSNDISDTASVWSTSSNTSFFKIPRVLSKKSSSSSIQTTTSRSQTDTLISSSRRPSSVVEPQMSPKLRSTGGSFRKLAAPPSSFNNRAIGQDTRTTNVINVFDEDHLITTKDIMQEILNVEAEAKRLMDAFNGLEVTTLARSQRNHVRTTLKPPDFGTSNAESNWGDSEGRSQRRVNLADDALSLRSATSSVAPSLARSAYSTRKPSRTKITPLNSPIGPTTNSRPGSLHRKNSTSSMTSERKPGKTAMAPPPVPALPNPLSHGHLKGANASSVSLARSTGHPPMDTLHEDNTSTQTLRMEAEEVETELEDIRRRREEVNQRYEARLEYLRAKLKGAQLHEKLMRK